MVFDTYHIIYLLANFFLIFVVHRFMRVFFEHRKYKRILGILAYSFYFIMTTLVYLLIDIPLITLITNLITMFIISLFFINFYLVYSRWKFIKRHFLLASNKWIISLIKRTFVYMYLFMAAAEIIAAAMTGYINFSVFSQGEFRDTFGLIATRIVAYCETLLLENIKLTRKGRNISWISWLASIVIPISTLILEVIIANQTNLTKVEAVGSVLLLFAVNIIAFYLYELLAENYIKR